MFAEQKDKFGKSIPRKHLLKHGKLNEINKLLYFKTIR